MTLPFDVTDLVIYGVSAACVVFGLTQLIYAFLLALNIGPMREDDE